MRMNTTQYSTEGIEFLVLILDVAINDEVFLVTLEPIVMIRMGLGELEQRERVPSCRGEVMTPGVVETRLLRENPLKDDRLAVRRLTPLSGTGTRVVVLTAPEGR